VILGTACSRAEDPVARSAIPTVPEFGVEQAGRERAHASLDRFPLDLGARWTYDVILRERYRRDGEVEYGPWTTQRLVRTSRCSRALAVDGTDYFEIEHAFRSLDKPSQVTPVRVQLVRQDPAGLYERPGGGTVFVTGASRGGPVPGYFERTLLTYPFHVGARWDSGLLDGTTFELEAIEPIRLDTGVEPAARVRARTTHVLSKSVPELTWFGRSGILRTWKRTELPTQNPAGQLIFQERITEEMLTSYVPG
jgi:hypothetical protein